jgi:hypothetical protein
VKYMILIYGSQRDYDSLMGKSGSDSAWSAEDFEALATFMGAFNKDLADSGELVDTRGLGAPVHTRRVQLQRGVPVVTDGPYAETQEVLAGFWIVECASFDRATEIAARLLNSPGPTSGSSPQVDVRPVAESRHDLDL